MGKEEGRNIILFIINNSKFLDIINFEFLFLFENVDEVILCFDFESVEWKLYEVNYLFFNEFLFCFNYVKVLILRGKFDEVLKWCERSCFLEKILVFLW